MSNSKKDIIIRQPGKIGDLIITAPIAYQYILEGRKVYWPILKQYFSSFNSAFEEIKWISFESSERLMYRDVNSIINDIQKTNTNTEILDLGFDFIDTESITTQYTNQKYYTFDEYKYHLANVDISNKWNLKQYLKRNHQREQKLFNDLVRKDKYIVIQEKSSDQEIKINLESKDLQIQIIKIYPVTNNIFDWLLILEKATSLLLIESCFSNLVDQLQIQNPEQVLILKNLDYYHGILPNGKIKGCPILKNKWKKMTIQ